MRLLPALVTILPVSILTAQDLTTRETIARNLKQALSTQTQLQWKQIPNTPGHETEAANVSSTLTDVTIDMAGCTLSFKDGRLFPDQNYRSEQTWKLPLAEIDRTGVDSMEGFVNRFRTENGAEKWETRTSPAVFTLQFYAASNNKFAVHRWSKNNTGEVIERDLKQPYAFIVFGSEAAAKNAASALETAKAACRP